MLSFLFCEKKVGGKHMSKWYQKTDKNAHNSKNLSKLRTRGYFCLPNPMAASVWENNAKKFSFAHFFALLGLNLPLFPTPAAQTNPVQAQLLIIMWLCFAKSCVFVLITGLRGTPVYQAGLVSWWVHDQLFSAVTEGRDLKPKACCRS
jgi:hypothetical protein